MLGFEIVIVIRIFAVVVAAADRREELILVFVIVRRQQAIVTGAHAVGFIFVLATRLSAPLARAASGGRFASSFTVTRSALAATASAATSTTRSFGL